MSSRLRRAGMAVGIVLVTMVLSGCSQSLQVLPPQKLDTRSVGTYLLVGCVVLEVLEQPVRSLVVSIDHVPPSAAQSRMPDRTFVAADSLGYFALPNLQTGDYWIRGVIVNNAMFIANVGGSSGPALASWKVDNGEDWLERNRRLKSSPLRPNEYGIIDAGVIILEVEGNSFSVRDVRFGFEVSSQNFGSIIRHRLQSGTVYSRKSPSLYFAERNPESNWARFLRADRNPPVP